MCNICKQHVIIIINNNFSSMFILKPLAHDVNSKETYPVDCFKLLRWSCMRECWQDVENADRSQQQRGHDSPCNFSKSPAVCVVVSPAVESFSLLLLPRLFFLLSQAYVVCAAVLFFSRLRPALPSWTSSLEHPRPPSSSLTLFPHKILNGKSHAAEEKMSLENPNWGNGTLYVFYRNFCCCYPKGE